MAESARLICGSAALADGGDGVRFELEREHGAAVPAFVVRVGGAVRAFVNRCAHVPVELDWMPGRFLDSDRRLIICATHGALYEPATGRCVAGPCRGATLEALEVFELDGNVYLRLPPP
jgi:nitrite reductase/ring-hydroxylating ferredoxin subunit